MGVDNLRASLALGQLELPRRRRWQFVAGFGLAEGLAPLVGAAAVGAARRVDRGYRDVVVAAALAR